MSIQTERFDRIRAENEAIEKGKSTGLEGYAEESKQKKEQHILSLSNAAKTVIDDLDYNSSEEDFDKARELNQEWYDQALDYFGRDKKKMATYGAINESRLLEITNEAADAKNYSNLNISYNTTWDEIQDLQTEAEDFDFSEVEAALNDFRTVGQNVLEYNKQWVNKAEYQQRIKDSYKRI